MGDLVKNERTLLTSGSTNRKTGWKSFQIQQTIRLTFSFDTRLHQLLVGKFSPTWNILQPPEPQDAHSKGPKSLKKDSHHGKNKSLENRYIKICSSSICIPDINLPTLKIASFFLKNLRQIGSWTPSFGAKIPICICSTTTYTNDFFKPHKRVIFFGYSIPEYIP